jgi:hypothetical protein
MQVCKFLLSSYKFGDVCGTLFLLKKTRKMIRDVHIFLFFSISGWSTLGISMKF